MDADIYKTPLAGGTGGTPFELAVPGKKVSKLEFWAQGLVRNDFWGKIEIDQARLIGVRVTFDDKSVRQAGAIEGERPYLRNTSLSLEPTDTIMSLTTTSNPTLAGGARST